MLPGQSWGKLNTRDYFTRQIGKTQSFWHCTSTTINLTIKCVLRAQMHRNVSSWASAVDATVEITTFPGPLADFSGQMGMNAAWAQKGKRRGEKDEGMG